MTSEFFNIDSKVTVKGKDGKEVKGIVLDYWKYPSSVDVIGLIGYVIKLDDDGSWMLARPNRVTSSN